MNIGFFSETYEPDINGVITSMKMFKEELERAGHTVYVFAPSYERFSLTGRNKEKHIFRFNSFTYPFYKSIRVAIPFDWPIQRKIPKLKLDVVHSHTPFSMGLFATAVARQEKIPHIHTYHTLYPEYVKFYFPGFQKWNTKAAEKFSAIFCNAASEIIAPSDGIRQKLISYGITKPITTLPTGVAKDFFTVRDPKHEIRHRYGIPANAPLLITVARLGREKSIDFLLRSFKKILKDHPDAWYLIAGDGPAHLELETLARELGVIERTVFTGFLKSRTDVIKAYATSNVFVFASRTDTQCLTLLEAAAAGLPLVAIRDKPLETALTDGTNGYFTKVNQNEFAKKVSTLLSDKRLARTFGRASVNIAKDQTATKRARQLVEIYDRAIAAKSSSLG